MSNQRAGKWKSATLRDGSGMQTVTFFKIAKIKSTFFNLF